MNDPRIATLKRRLEAQASVLDVQDACLEAIEKMVGWLPGENLREQVQWLMETHYGKSLDEIWAECEASAEAALMDSGSSGDGAGVGAHVGSEHRSRATAGLGDGRSEDRQGTEGARADATPRRVTMTQKIEECEKRIKSLVCSWSNKYEPELRAALDQLWADAVEYGDWP